MTIKVDPKKAFVGIDAEKADVYIPTDQHCLIAGASGAGKSTMLYNVLVHDIHVARLRPDVMQVWLSDPVGYFRILEGGFARPYAREPHEMHAFWDDVRAEMRRRATAFDDIQKQGTMVEVLGPANGWPWLRIYQDELGAAIKDINGYRRSQLEPGEKLLPFGDDLDYFARTLRKYGMFLVLADQEPKQDSFPVTARRQCNVKIALRFDDQGAARNAIDDYVKQAPAHTIEPDLKGRCYVIGGVGYRKPVEVQGAYLTPSEIERLGKKLGKPTGRGAESAPRGDSSSSMRPTAAGTPRPVPRSDDAPKRPDPLADWSPPTPPKVVAESKSKVTVEAWYVLACARKPMSTTEIDKAMGDGDNRKGVKKALEQMADDGAVKQDDDGLWLAVLAA